MSKGTNAAFTLLELILVLVILSAGAALVLPRFEGVVSRQKLRSAASTILSICGRAHTEASALALRYRVAFDLEAQTYWVERESNPLAEPNEFETVLHSWAQVRKLPAGITFQEVELEDDEHTQSSEDNGCVYVQFLPTGSADSAAIHLVSKAGDELSLQIEQSTGRVHLLEGEDQAPGASGS